MDSVIYVNPDKIKTFIVALFCKLNMSSEDAAMIADNLIDADLRGVPTHGITRIPMYIQKIQAGLCISDATPEIIKNFGATAIIDAKHSMGQVSSTMAMRLAIQKASGYGIGFVGVRNGTHYGTAGFYAMMAEKVGMVGLSSTNSGTFVAPFGGIEKRLGTNPIAVALPAKRHLPVLLDMATSKISRGKLIVASKKGVPIPDDWALDCEGNVTSDPIKAFAGILLPLGYKGSGMAIVIDMLSGILMGSGFGTMVDTSNDFPKVGSTFMAINTEVFCEPEVFAKNVDCLIDEIKSARHAEGIDEILMPGEIEFKIQSRNMSNGGVPLQPFHIEELSQQAEQHGLSLNDYLD